MTGWVGSNLETYKLITTPYGTPVVAVLVFIGDGEACRTSHHKEQKINIQTPSILEGG